MAASTSSTGVSDKAKAPGALDVWLSHYHIVREGFPLLKWLLGLPLVVSKCTHPKKSLCSSLGSLGNPYSDVMVVERETLTMFTHLYLQTILNFYKYFQITFQKYCRNFHLLKWLCDYLSVLFLIYTINLLNFCQKAKIDLVE
jgi:hypothetical protein